MGFLFIPKFPRSEASGYVADQEEDRRNAPGADKFSQWATKDGWQRKKGEAAESIPEFCFPFWSPALSGLAARKSLVRKVYLLKMFLS